MTGHSAEKDVLRAAGYHVERQGTYDNRMKRLAVLENQLRWAEEEKEHHEKWLSGILDESRRLRDRFNRITAALAASGVEWSVIAGLIGDETRPLPPAETGQHDSPRREGPSTTEKHSGPEIERALAAAGLQEGADDDRYWTGRLDAVEIVRDMLGLPAGEHR